jgi:hypothetical protein
MRRTNKASRKRSQLAKQTQERAVRVERQYDDAATMGLKASSRSIGNFNDGFRQITEEMSAYSVRSFEQVVRAWKQFLDAGPLRQAVELQTRYAENAQNAFEAYVDEVSRLGDLYLDVTRRVSKPLAQTPRRSK